MNVQKLRMPLDILMTLVSIVLIANKMKVPHEGISSIILRVIFYIGITIPPK